jgi:molybdate transport system substrate-binding protein
MRLFTTLAGINLAEEAAAMFQDQSGITVDVQSGGPADIARRIRAGEAFDIIIGNSFALSQYKDDGFLATLEPLAYLSALLVYRSGNPPPDTSNLKSLKQFLLNAKAISVSDPQFGGTTGIVLKTVAKSLDIVSKVEAKLIYTAAGRAAEPVESGFAEMAVAQSSEVIDLNNIDWVELLPGDSKGRTVFAIGISAQSQDTETARSFVSMIRSNTGIYQKWGFSFISE